MPAMLEVEYHQLGGEGWSLTAAFKGGGMVPSLEIGPDAIGRLVNFLLDENNAPMTFDEHPKTVRRIEMDFERKSLKIYA
jgi:hypothetical protein